LRKLLKGYQQAVSHIHSLYSLGWSLDGDGSNSSVIFDDDKWRVDRNCPHVHPPGIVASLLYILGVFERKASFLGVKLRQKFEENE
jgi:hypothetical protein